MAFTATCFGGPLDRQRVASRYSTLLCHVPVMADLGSWDVSSPAPMLERTRTYTYRKLAHGPFVFPAWLYDGGWIEDEPVERHVVLAVQLMWEIARVWNGVPNPNPPPPA